MSGSRGRENCDVASDLRAVNQVPSRWASSNWRSVLVCCLVSPGHRKQSRTEPCSGKMPVGQAHRRRPVRGKKGARRRLSFILLAGKCLSHASLYHGFARWAGGSPTRFPDCGRSLCRHRWPAVGLDIPFRI